MGIEMKQIMECINNPVKTQILMLLQQKGRMTPKELLQASENIPQATLYRALKKLEQEGIIKVAAETKVRAVTEKTYTVSEEYTRMEGDLLSNNDGAAYSRMFAAFTMELMMQFESYGKRGGIDLAKDGSGFSAVPIYATVEELIQYGQQIKNILEPAMKRTSDKQKLYTFANIITPPKEG